MTQAVHAVRPYERLRSAILALDYVPGERLTERALEGDLDASRTPIRAALMRLESEGLVRREGREGRGWSVAPIDLTEIRALSEYREAVEVAGVRLAVVRASDADLDALEQMSGGLLLAGVPAAGALPVGVLDGRGALDAAGVPGAAGALNAAGVPGIAGVSGATGSPASEDDVVRSGGEFHALLAQLSGNRFMADAISGVMTRLERTRWLEVRTPESRRHALDEHRAIVAALRARDSNAVAALVGDHVRGSASRTLGFLAEERRRLRGRGFAIVESEPSEPRPAAV